MVAADCPQSKVYRGWTCIAISCTVVCIMFTVWQGLSWSLQDDLGPVNVLISLLDPLAATINAAYSRRQYEKSQDRFHSKGAL